jgi:thiol-disulfide isomerase/thioredoxin
MSGNRRTFFRAAAAALAAAGFGMSCAKAQSTVTALPDLSSSEGTMPSLAGTNEWLNSPPLTTAGLRSGSKVVLVNFWTYTCINWLRQLPYVRAWAETYTEHGLVVIGVHTPEFSFEHNIDNVRRAARDMRVQYPIAIDNDYAVWRVFANNYWPALYFVDAIGRIRHHHFGEGAYEESERVLQQLLREAGNNDLGPELVTVDARGAEVAADSSDLRSGEKYLGLARTDNFVSPGGPAQNSARVYVAPAQLSLNEWALDGNWTFQNEAVVLNEGRGRILLRFHSRDLNLVMGPGTPGTSVRFRVLVDGVAPGAAHGIDVNDQGDGTLAEQRLYQLIRQQPPIADRQFEITFLDTGAAGYAFTFG